MPINVAEEVDSIATAEGPEAINVAEGVESIAAAEGPEAMPMSMSMFMSAAEGPELIVEYVIGIILYSSFLLLLRPLFCRTLIKIVG